MQKDHFFHLMEQVNNKNVLYSVLTGSLGFSSHWVPGTLFTLLGLLVWSLANLDGVDPGPPAKPGRISCLTRTHFFPHTKS